MTKLEVISAMVRVARAINRRLCFHRDIVVAAEQVHGAEPLAAEATHEVEILRVRRNAWITSARYVESGDSLGAAAEDIKTFCAGSCTAWALDPNRAKNNLKVHDAELHEFRTILRFVITRSLAIQQQEAA